MHYTFSNCFDLSPQLVKDFLVKALANVKHMPRDLHQELNKTLAFSFCAPSHVNENSTLYLQPGSSVMTLVGFALLAEVSFSEDYYDATGFGISCVCRWKNEEGHINRLERTFHYWAPGEAIPKVQEDHIFVFSDVKVFPRTGEINNPDILADLVVFEFFPVDKEMERLDDSCTVTKCGLYIIDSDTKNTRLEMSSTDSFLDLMEFYDSYVEEELRASYNGLQEIDKALFLYIACMFNDKDVDLVAPRIATGDLDISSGLKVLAKMSLIHVSSNGQIVMHGLQRKMGKEILYRKSILPGSSKDLSQDIKEVFVASSTSRNWVYDVYPSFSGQDVRQTFLSHLLSAFRRKGIIMFQDIEIVRGQVVFPLTVQAIRESRILIVVFSKNYASSSWNLNNLVEIAKSKEELGQKVLPIFYNVDPLDVRRQVGTFGLLFKQSFMNKTEDEKQRWRQALADITNISGFLSMDWNDEAQMMENIVDEVLRSRNITASQDFDNCVGMEDHISRMSSLLCLESEVVRMVGIWGPSGIGKSTIARFLYSRLARSFQFSIFVDSAFIYKTMENSRREKLDEYDTKLHLQTQFLSKVLGQKYIKVDHLGMVREMLKDQKVLVILDDVNDQVLLDTLVGNTLWFGTKSRIIVITQDKRLLKSHGIDIIYQVDLPSKEQALEMFCESAFRQNYPPYGFMQLTVEVAEIVGNLPLGLNVLGSSLRGTDKTEWMEMLPWIRKSLDEKMEILLESHMTDRDLNVMFGLTSLVEKSLIHITEQGSITMPLLQQKLGREIVRKESTHEPGGRRFLVDYQDICEVLEDETDAERVLGISLNMSEVDELVISKRAFSGMKNLRFLKLYTNLENREGKKEVNVHLPLGLDYLSRKLKLLHWEAFPMRFMPSNFCPKNLVEFTMEASNLEELWEGVQPLGSLKIMNLRDSLCLEEIPNLSYANNLQKLDLGDCLRLVELPSSIRNLHALRDLDMEGCIELEDLPTGFNLESLDCLNLKGCSRLRSFPEFSRNISNLYLDGTVIEEIPSWIENMSRLSYLSMNGCNELKKISPNISKLKHLVEVDFSNCGALGKDSWHLMQPPFSLIRVDRSGNSFTKPQGTRIFIQVKDLILKKCQKPVSLL